MKKSSQTNNPESILDAEEYTKEELEALDDYHKITGKIFDDEEIYQLMQRFDNDKTRITQELKEMLKVANKGDEYKWHEVNKSKLNNF